MMTWRSNFPAFELLSGGPRRHVAAADESSTETVAAKVLTNGDPPRVEQGRVLGKSFFEVSISGSR